MKMISFPLLYLMAFMTPTYFTNIIATPSEEARSSEDFLIVEKHQTTEGILCTQVVFNILDHKKD
jgi:hypothetical protein